MSQENHEQRIAALEKKMDALVLAFTAITNTDLRLTDEFLVTQKSVGSLATLLFELRPDLKDSKIVGAIHGNASQIEISRELVDDARKKFEASISPAPPNPGTEPPNAT
jgi:hypothetical protein